MHSKALVSWFQISPGHSVKDVMDTWTKQMGLPVVTIEITGNTVKATQRRFLADSSINFNSSSSEYGYLA